jgi:hypothetical protein
MSKQPTSRMGVTQTVAFDGTVAVTNPFGAQTRQIRIVANSHCHYHLYDPAGSATAAVLTDPYLTANRIEYVTVTPGQKISAIKSPTAGLITEAAGTLWITEIA